MSIKKWRIRGLIFDFDGVVVNSEPVQFETFSKVVKKFGVNLDFKRWGEFAGTNGRHILTTLLNEVGILKSKEDKLINSLISKRKKLYLKEVEMGKVKLKKGLIDFLKLLNKNKIPAVIASGSREEIIRYILRKENIENYFLDVFGGESVQNPKPNPDIFLLSLKRLEIKRENCVIIEDSTNGIKGAMNAGINFICMYNDYNPTTKQLKECPLIIENYNEIPLGILDDLNDKA